MVKADLVIVHANELLTMRGFSDKPKRRDELKDLGIIRDGAVAIKEDKIVAVGTTREVLDRVEKGFQVIDASGKVVAPAFIDPHVHLVFGCTREDELEMMVMGESYIEIKKKTGGIMRTINCTRNASTEELLKRTARILDQMLLHGTTVIEGKSGYEMTLEGEIRQLEIMKMLDKLHPVDIIPTFNPQAIPPEYEGREDEFAEEIAMKWVPEIAKRGLAVYCDAFCDVGYFQPHHCRRIFAECRKHGMKLKIHADWLANSGGGRLAVELGVVSADHLIHTPMEIIDEIAKKNIIGVLLPTTPFCYLGRYANAREIIKRGVPVALGTDVSAIDMSESMQMMMTIASLQMKMLSAEVWSAATINAAHAVEKAHMVGSIEEGKRADIIILDIPNYRHIPFHYGVNHVETVIKAGRIVVEDRRLVKEAIPYHEIF
ncbi:MAG: imidazolonepropionase [Pyrodictiaceae archaeon]